MRVVCHSFLGSNSIGLMCDSGNNASMRGMRCLYLLSWVQLEAHILFGKESRSVFHGNFRLHGASLQNWCIQKGAIWRQFEMPVLKFIQALESLSFQHLSITYWLTDTHEYSEYQVFVTYCVPVGGAAH